MATEERAKVTITGDVDDIVHALRALDKQVASSQKGLSKLASGVGKRIGSAVSGLAGGVAGIGGLATVGGFALAADEALQFEEQLTRIAIQAGASAGETDVLRASLNDASSAFGVSRSEIVGGVDALVNLQGASAATPENIRLIAKAMAATGASAEDLAGTMFGLQDTFGLDSAALEETLSSLNAIGKEGSIPLKELATTLQQQGANMVDFVGKGREGAAQAAALLQILRKGSGSAAEAGTLAKSIGTAFKSKAKDLKRFGVQVFRMENGVKVMRDIDEIVGEIATSKLAKDPEKLLKVLGSTEAEAGLKVLLKNLDAYNGLIAAGQDLSSIQKDATAFLSSSAGRQQKAINDLKQSIAAVFTPEVIEGFTVALEGTLAAGRALYGTLEAIGTTLNDLLGTSDALADAFAEITGLNDKMQRKEAANTNLLLAEQAAAFGAGEIDPKQRKFIETFEGGKLAAGMTPEEIAAQRIVAQAERDKLIIGDQVAPLASNDAFLRAQGAAFNDRTPAQQALADQQVRGLERALQVLADAEKRRRGQDPGVKVDVDVSGEGTARAAVKKKRSG